MSDPTDEAYESAEQEIAQEIDIAWQEYEDSQADSEE